MVDKLWEDGARHTFPYPATAQSATETLDTTCVSKHKQTLKGGEEDAPLLWGLWFPGPW